MLVQASEKSILLKEAIALIINSLKEEA